jgi:hypothetical protein
MERTSLEIKKGNKSTHELQNVQILTTKEVTVGTYLDVMMLPWDRLAGARRTPTGSGPPPNGSGPHRHEVVVVEADEQVATGMKMTAGLKLPATGSGPPRRGLTETDRIWPASD